MKSEGLSERSALEGRSLYSTGSNTVSRLNSEIVEESDADDYYPFVMGHGTNCRVIDPKVYKQLRKHNIKPRYSVRIAECARKNSPNNQRVSSESVKSSDSGDDDEYCKLSPLAKLPSVVPTRPKPSVLSNGNAMDLKRLPSFERRFFSDYKSKLSVVESNRSSPSGRPVTKVVSSTASANKTEIHSEWDDRNDTKRERYCGMEADEVIDYATCMCCAKGLLYHCTKDTQEGEEAHTDNPCSCTGPIGRCGPRWVFLTALSIFLPCLWCYLPVAGCRKAASKSCTKRKKTDKLKAKPARKA